MSHKLVKKMSEFIKVSMQTKNTLQLNAGRNIKAVAQDIALRDKRKELKDEDIIVAATKNKKEAVESMNIYRAFDTPVANDNFAKAYHLDLVCDMFLPAQLTILEITYKVQKIISELNASTMKDMGKVMKQFKEENPVGTFDAKLVSTTIKDVLK